MYLLLMMNDDEKEMKITHRGLLFQPKDEYDMVFPELNQPSKASRSVLGDIGNEKRSQTDGKSVSWLELVRGNEQKSIRQ